MGLSNELISQFVKITNDSSKPIEEMTVYGTIVEYEGTNYVRLDGSELLTPITTAANVKPGERVTVMIKNHTATVTGNLSSPSARIGDLDGLDDVANIISEFEIVLAQKVDTEDLVAEQARIDALIAKDAEITGTLEAAEADIDILQANQLSVTERLEAAEAKIDNLDVGNLDVSVLDAKYAKIEDLEATNTDIHNLESTYADFEVATTNKFTAVDAVIADLDAAKLSAGAADIKYAKISDLEATDADVSNLSAEIADIDTLIFGSASGNTIQSSFANAVIAQLGNAQIKSAMIESISADKVTAGDIITNNVRIRSEDGSLNISDETIQISDDNRVRVQIGKDASGDYSINIWDIDGNLMFSKGGITDSAIKDAIIRNDMVSDTANISAHKLDIDSLFEEINGSSKTIKSTRIYLDDESQTLDVAFKEMETDVSGLSETVSSQGTQLSVVQGKIDSKVWQQDIDAISIGGRNLLLDTDFGDDPMHFERATSDYATEIGARFIPSVETELGVEYTVSARLRGNANVVFYEITDGTNKSHQWVTRDTLDETEFKLFTKTFTANASNGRLVQAFICTQWGEDNTLVGDWFEIAPRSVKLERGNKATDWTPAPEDTETILSTLSDQYSAIEQTIEGISTTVANHASQISSKADDSKVTEINNKVSEIEQTVDGISATVANHTSQISSKADGSTVTEVSNKVGTLELSLNQFQTTVSETYATKSEVESTTETMNSAIEQKANSIMSSVSSTYATKQDLEDASFDTSSLITIGGRNLLPGTDFDGASKRYERLESYTTEGGFHFYPTEQIESGVEYTLSLSMRGNANIVFYEINTTGSNVSHSWIKRDELSETDYKDFHKTFAIDPARVLGDIYICTQWGDTNTLVGDWFEIEPRSLKLERGNRKTDWSPAPEDMATAKDAEDAQVAVTHAETLIQQLADSISMLVTDGNGSSLMTQTEDGWTFSTAEIQSSISSAAEDLHTLQNELGSTSNTVDVLQQTVADLGELADYVKIGTYDAEPCIELGESDSEFKLRITNTRILFMEDTSVIAHFTNKSLNIKKAVIEEELQQGKFVWQARSNGNLGLIWKG